MNEIFDRKGIIDDTEKESRLSDLKQHADKLLQGFAELKQESIHRAVWELVQNACDLTDKCRVTIDYSDHGFAFTHNGKPFTTHTLISLIKQVSNKENQKEEVGRFGTGFITTHVFGRSFKIFGQLEARGNYLPLNGFEIDRRTKAIPNVLADQATEPETREWRELGAKLQKQEDAVYDLIKTAHPENNFKEETTFRYLPETTSEHEAVKISQERLFDYIPLVMTLNDRLQQVTIKGLSQGPILYEKESKEPTGDYWLTKIKRNGETLVYRSLRNEENEVEVILPIGADNKAFLFPENIARLFLFFPLIGSETWGCNFIIHSKKFAPTEPRNGIHLKSRNDQVQILEEQNRKLIACASKLVFTFLEKHSENILDPIHLASIEFNTVQGDSYLNEYYQGLKTDWLEKFSSYKLVHTKHGNKTPTEITFLDSSLLLDKTVLDKMYGITSHFYPNLPDPSVIEKWAAILESWGITTVRKIRAEILATEIAKAGSLQAIGQNTELLSVYHYFQKHCPEISFAQTRLLPNIDGNFDVTKERVRAVNMNEDLVRISRILFPKIAERLTHPDFILELGLSEYNRNRYSLEISEEVQRKITDQNTAEKPDEKYLHALLDYCRLASSADSDGAYQKLIREVCKYFKYPEDIIVVPAVKEDRLDNRTVQRKLITLFLNELSAKEANWIETNITTFHSVLETGTSFKDFEDLFTTKPVFPNQLFEPRKQSELKIDGKIPKEIKDYYDKIVKPTELIRSRLVLEGFEKYLTKKDVEYSRDLTEPIEANLFKEGKQIEINSHDFQDDIITIIKRIHSDEDWTKLFPRLSDYSAEIMLSRITEKSIKDNVFNIVSQSPDKINQLGKLAENPAMEIIIFLGELALRQQQRDDADLYFKKKLGLHIEKLVREKLELEVIDFQVTIREQQGGQDIIVIYKGEEVYFIEVKSRWSIKNSYILSTRQSQNAARRAECFALCAVNLFDHEAAVEKEPERIENIDVIIDRIWFSPGIGEQIAPLLEPNMAVENDEESIRLNGDYSVLIPVVIAESGKSLSDFIDHLISILNLDSN